MTIRSSKIRTFLLALFALFALGACGGGGGGGGAGAGSPDHTSFAFTLTSYQRQTISGPVDVAASSPMFTADQLLNGQLSVTDTATGITQVFPWSVYLDETTLEVQSNRTIVLPPGTYDFALLLTRGAQQYAGLALAQAVADGANSIAMTVSPIIGDTIADVSVVAELADFRFQYDPAELASFSNPQIGIVLDGGTELIFAVNPATGLSNAFVNLPPGAHTIQLKFYEGTLQVGKSLPSQENVVVVPGVDLIMDLIALQGDINLDLTADGGTANFQFTIPGEVVTEAGGLSALEARFSLSGALNGYREAVLSLSPDGSGNFTASVSLTGVRYEDVTLQIIFSDISVSPAETLGACVVATTLDATPLNLGCDLILRRRAVVTGNLLATVGLSAVDDIGAPAAGASVYLDSNLVGMTNGTGFLKLYVLTGMHTIHVENATNYGETSVDAAPLGLYNLLVTLDQPLIPPIGNDCPTGTFTASDGAAYSRNYDASTAPLDINGDCTIDPRVDLIPAPVTNAPSSYGQYRVYDSNGAMLERWTIAVVSQELIADTGPGVDFPIDGSFAAGTVYFTLGTGDWTANYCLAQGGTVHIDRNDAAVGGVLSGTFTNVGSGGWQVLSGSPSCPPLPISGTFSIPIEGGAVTQLAGQLFLYDDFTSGTIDLVKWSPQVSANGSLFIIGGQADLAVDNTISGAGEVSRLNLIDHIVPFTAMAADFTVTSYNEVSSPVRGRWFVHFYNDNNSGTATPGSAVDDIAVNVNINATTAWYQVFRCNDATCGAGITMLNTGDLATDLALGETHTLFVGWDSATTFTFQIDARPPVVVNVGGVAPFVGYANFNRTAIGARITPSGSGQMSMSVDNVYTSTVWPN